MILLTAMVWMYLSSSNSYVEILMPNAMVLGGRLAFGRWLGLEGKATMNEVNDLIKEAWESSRIPSAT